VLRHGLCIEEFRFWMDGEIVRYPCLQLLANFAYEVHEVNVKVKSRIASEQISHQTTPDIFILCLLSHLRLRLQSS